MTEQPSGTVTFLFTDIEGSTRLLAELGADRYAEALERHRAQLREAFERHRGYEVNCEGDSFVVAFPTASGAAAAAVEAQQALAGGQVRVRMGLHTGEPLLAPPKYVGLDVHTAARIMAAGHGGQVLVSQATRDLLADHFSLADLGEHRLKDLSSPQRLYQLGEGDFPSLKTLRQTNLPVAPTPFLGRERELSEVTALLARDDVRLLTLTGAGGTGKTRLALQAAAELSDGYTDGVHWVALAAIRDPALVLPTIAHSLGASDGLAVHLAPKRMLLLLDNFEHVVEAAPELADVLGVSPALNVLVTSREPLRLSGEREYAVATLRERDAIALFTERALAVRSDFAGNGEVAEICRRLDHLPLAVELAAARVKALSPRALLERLEQRLPLLTGGPRDVPDRQRTLRDTIAWSFGLLHEGEQELFARLSVFAGGCTLEAAEAVCDADLDTLASLVDKSLVRQSDDRFWMLETIREFAAEQLLALDEARIVQLRHAEFFLERAEQSFDEFGEAADARGYVDFGTEEGNYRAALATFLVGAGGALRLTQRVWVAWLSRGQLQEGERWVTLALEADADAPAEIRAWMLGILGEFLRFRGEHERAIEVKKRAIVMTRSLGMKRQTKALLCDMAESLAGLGRVEEARPLLDEALELERAEDDQPAGSRTMRARSAAAEVAMLTGDYEQARRRYVEILDHFAPGADESTSIRAWGLTSFGECLRRMGDSSGAERQFRDALALAAEAHVLTWAPDAIDGLAGVTAARSAYESAVLFATAERARRDTGLAVWDSAIRSEIEAAIRGSLDEQAFESARAEGLAKPLDDAIAYALEMPATEHSPTGA
jgi:predicted ATPase/class 3 adenylate cyclase